MINTELFNISKNSLILEHNNRCGQVVYILKRKSSRIYTGINIDLPAASDFFAEQTVIAAMLKHEKLKPNGLKAIYKQ